VNGAFDHNSALVGADLITFVDQRLFPYLATFRQTATGPKTIHYKIGEIFTELRNKFRSGYILRDVQEVVDSTRIDLLGELFTCIFFGRHQRHAGESGGADRRGPAGVPSQAWLSPTESARIVDIMLYEEDGQLKSDFDLAHSITEFDRLSHDFPRLCCVSGAAVRHLIHGGRRRWSDLLFSGTPSRRFSTFSAAR
jgi:hypothetical protein